VVIPLCFPGIEASDLETVHDLTHFAEANMTNFIAQAEALGEARGLALGEARGEAKGEARGLALGEARGEAKGLSNAVLRLLDRKFSDVSEDVRSRVLSADAEQLGSWIDRILTAGSVEEVFNG